MKISKELRDAARRNFEGIKDSKTFCVIWNESMVDDVIPLIQMGLAVYLDKPIVVVVPKGRGGIPANIRAMAVKIIEVDFDDPNAMEQAKAEFLRAI